MNKRQNRECSIVPLHGRSIQIKFNPTDGSDKLRSVRMGSAELVLGQSNNPNQIMVRRGHRSALGRGGGGHCCVKAGVGDGGKEPILCHVMYQRT